ncbi:hypothetical protein OG936_06125 [Streptomyces sp. NBC_00846]|uniref:hypothetical protein n=1 Tax=Streptomyces sp. NBC_00846 TaxID=2975849 RepID=UPI003867A057|nr:hypothetical protein OG936_06125 [Streptomyces sp. NBC_00846]
MSLRLLLPEDGVTELLLAWPDEPRVYERGKTTLDETFTADSIKDLLFTGCAPAHEIAVVKAPNPSLSRDAFMTNGRTDPARLRKLHNNGHTIRLGNLQRVVPYLAHGSKRIQEETGRSFASTVPPTHTCPMTPRPSND